MKILTPALMFLTGILILGMTLAAEDEEATASGRGAPVPAALSFTMTSLEGEEIDLARYQGKVVMIVNTASRCGLTPQYKALQALHEKYADQGLVILGFPANDFNQELATDEAIAEFCEENYGVTFQMFSLVSVKGEGQCDLYALLTAAEGENVAPGAINWNFEKFLLDRDGNVAWRFAPRVAPDAPQVIEAIEAELARSSN